MSKTKTVVVRSTERNQSNNPVYRITLPKSFVEENKRIIGREFKPVMSFTGNIVFKRV